MGQRQRWLIAGLVVVTAGGLWLSPSAAFEQLERQLDIRPNNRTEGLSRDVADQFLRLGSQEAAAGNFDAAIAAWHRAIAIYDALGDSPSAGIAYDYIGLTYASRGRYTEAEDTLRRRLAVARDNADYRGQVYGLNNLGSVFVQRGYLNSALDTFQTALRIAEDVRDPNGIGLSLSNLGLVAQLQGNLADARKYYEAATNYRYRAGDLAGEANSSNNLGRVYRQLGEEGRALGAFLVARDAARRAGDVPNQLRALDGLMEIYRDRNEATQVRRFLDERITLTEAPETSASQRLATLVQLGQYYELTGEFLAAQEAYQAALGLARQIQDNPQAAFLANRLQAVSRQVR